MTQNTTFRSLFIAAAMTMPATASDAEPQWREAASREAIIRDWMLQDYMNARLPDALEQEKRQWRDEHIKAPESKLDPPVLKDLKCFISDRDSVVEQRMIAHVLDELGSRGDRMRTEAKALALANTPGREPFWKRLYVRACELRRAVRLKPLWTRWQRFVFNQHRHVPGSWKYTEVLSDAHRNRQYRPGASLNILEMKGSYGRACRLLEDTGGILRNPDVSYDGQRILFAWKKSDRDDDFHLYEMDVATGDIRQLTHGLGFADFEGVYLPDGNIMFSSTRCGQTVDCNWVEVSNLYLMDQDGRYMRRVGFDQVHTIFPTVTDDGRVLYTRWEYSDRGQIYPQPLFQMHPDGTNQREFYGNNSWFPTNIIHARKVPGSRKVLAVITGHHRPAHGKLGLIDPALGRQEARGVQLIAPVRKTEPLQVDKYGLDGIQFQYPYPIDDEHFLVTLALPTPEGNLGRFDIYFMDVDGRRELLVEGQAPGEGVGCKQILPLASRDRPAVRPSTVDYEKTTGTVYLQDIYEGNGLAGVPRGAIKRLRVVALRYRAAAIGSLHQDGRGGHSEMTTPIAIGNGSWDVKVVLGSADVYEDGSAFFEVPARTPVYFQALDEKNRVVQTMRSWTALMPGEAQSCVGCHEHKNGAPRAGLGVSLAIEAGPQTLAPFYGPPRGFSFPNEVQPILDKHCIGCHNDKSDETFSLTGKLVTLGKTKRKFSQSYLAFTNTKGSCGNWNHAMVNWIDCMSEPSPLPPYHRGAATSELITLLEEGHEDVKLSREEIDKIACWIDLLVPYCGDYVESNAWSRQDLDFYARALAKRERWEEVEETNIKALIGSK